MITAARRYSTTQHILDTKYKQTAPCSISSSRREASSFPFIAFAIAFLSVRNLSTSCKQSQPESMKSRNAHENFDARNQIPGSYFITRYQVIPIKTWNPLSFTWPRLTDCSYNCTTCSTSPPHLRFWMLVAMASLFSRINLKSILAFHVCFRLSSPPAPAPRQKKDPTKLRIQLSDLW